MFILIKSIENKLVNAIQKTCKYFFLQNNDKINFILIKLRKPTKFYRLKFKQELQNLNIFSATTLP